ncbi:polymorphic toxin-type HINT domain-containing protein [Actinomadura sp. HBU206391]|uniref:polymorphic toxin-type HINT domain-containing protein n=1 Tax=Actinomadura sp. HBU206391 TaxID=2731692 RepID=UPI00164F0199|nr:polymorphic toxin-type HINT domain-containing protein [Actinomadura sp. HBU206391]MBC6460373.1 sugar-binding protein [Actinomadura sp. HBU206391]
MSGYVEDAVRTGGLITRTGAGRLRRHIAVVTAVVVGVGLLSAVPAQADEPGRPKVVDTDRVVKGHDLPAKRRKVDPAVENPAPAAKVAWPRAGTAEVTVPAPVRSGPGAGKVEPVRAGSLPVWVTAPGQGAGTAKAVKAQQVAGKVRVQVLDRTAAQRAGMNGMVFTVGRTDSPTEAASAAAGKVGVRVDYSGFARAFGGSYGSRLRLVRLPACAVTTPSDPRCREAVPVPVRNDTENKALIADVDAAPVAAAGSASTTSATAVGGASVLAAVAGESSDKGDYQATSLSPSATWQVSAQSGDFSWSYPMRVPPVPGGLEPNLALGYSSGSIDGRTSNTNNQSSWAGDGFELWPGFIERRYKSCKDDGAPKNDVGISPGDQCWGYDNATMTLAGKGGELIPDGNDRWRMKNDDGTRIEKLTSADTANGDNDGEYWKVTTPDGTRYYFGHNRLPGWVAGNPETKSAWTTPVFGDDDNEPCNKSSFTDSYCQQAYRWNLDYVVDPNGNAVTYYYTQEGNHYGRNLKPEDETAYDRGGWLNHAEYGLRSNNLFPARAPARVDFGVSERCIRATAADCATGNIADHPEYWEDVPWDLRCDSGQECKDEHGAVSPTFWSRKRLTSVTTKILKDDGSDYRPVDSWQLKHAWGTADADRQLLLESITHTGQASITEDPVSLPPVSFVYNDEMPNRVDKLGDDVGPFIKMRLETIYNETGGQLDVNYSDPDCTTTSLPAPENNQRRCFPTYWTKTSGDTEPTRDWFHKYVVTQTAQTDLTGGSPDMVTNYDYSIGKPAWHYDDDDGLTPEKYKTWSQWRGYNKVRVLTGGTSGMVSQTDHWYFQGMDGDRASTTGGEKDVEVTDGERDSAPYPDHESLLGMEVRTVTYDGVDGNVVTKAVKSPWHHQTASRTRSWGTVTANLTGVKTARALTALEGGAWREVRTTTNTFDTTTGAPLEVDHFGDWAEPDDDRCTTTDHATNATDWLLTYPSHVRTVARKCADNPNLSEDLISDVRTYYDNGELDAAPSKGNVTKTETAKAATGSTVTYLAGQATYDGYGRQLTSTDTASGTTTTVHTDTQGLNTKTVTTSPPAKAGDATTAMTTIKEFDPAWGNAVKETDAGGKSTNIAYDPLGRVAKVWGPNRNTSQQPDRIFAYRMVKNAIVAVTTKELNNLDGHDTSHELLDGWLRPRQSQAPGPDGGRLISDTFHNQMGKVDRTYATYYAADPPETTLFGVGTPGDVETQNAFTYDALGRTTTERLMAGSSDAGEISRTTYSYSGDRTTITPPEGGTPTTTITDAHGRTTELRQHWTGGPAGYASTTYQYTPAGQLASVTSPGNQTWTRTYDLRGRKIEASDPDTGTTKYTYDDLDRLTQTENARGKKIGVTYDGIGRMTTKYDQTTASPGTKLAEWTYDTVRKGQPATSTRYVGTNAYTSKVNYIDNLNRVTGYTITLPTSEGALAPANGYFFTTLYNPDGTVKSTGGPGAGGLSGETIAHTYDSLGRPTKTSGNLSKYVIGTDYSKTGKLLGLQMATADTGAKKTDLTYTYEPGTQRLKTATTVHDGAAGVDRDATYDYDDVGNITQIKDVSRAGTDNQCFRYDYLQRLTDAWAQGSATCAINAAAATLGGPAPYRVNYAYDVTGNRETETQYANGSVVTTSREYKYAGDSGVGASIKGHRLGAVVQTGTSPRTDTYTYDASGNTTARTIGTSTQTLDWGTEGELAKVTDSAKGETSFVYTPGGDRLIRRDPSGTTLYLPGMEIRLDKGTTTPKATRYYSHGGQAVAMRTSAGVTFLAGDHQGTGDLAVNAITGALTQRRFGPFGQDRGTPTGTWPGEKGFVGGTIDASTGLTHLGAREYDPATGRFTSVDPVFNPDNPQQINGYTYAQNNPVTDSDPSGLCSPLAGCPTNPGLDCAPSCGYDDGGDAGVPGGSFTPPVNKSCNWFCNTIGGLLSAGANETLGPIKDFSADLVEGMLKLGCPPTPTGCQGAIENAGNKSGIRNDIHILGDENSKTYRYSKFLAEWAPVILGGAAGIRQLSKLALRLAARRAAKKAPSIKPRPVPVNKDPAPGPGCVNSFVPGTKILLAGGTHKPIEDVNIGDKVLATNPETGESEAKEVLATITGDGQKNLVEVSVDIDGKRGNRTGLVIATDGHPFWVAGHLKKWIKAADLKPDMWLRTSAGTHVQITATKTWTQHQQVHNLTVDDIHTYYVEVEDTPVLVHNCGNTPPGVTCNCAPGTGTGPSDAPIRAIGPWTRADIGRGTRGLRPNQLGDRLEIHHADQMPGSAIHELDQVVHRGAGTDLHRNTWNQGVTNEMRSEDTQLHWWYRSQEQGWGLWSPQAWFDNWPG